MSEIDVMEQDAPDVVLPPTQDELPYDDGVPMETERHKLQMDLLIYPLKPWLNQRPERGYVGGNMFVYFSLEQVRHQDFRGPDVFVVLDVPKRERKSWVVWEEGKSPDVVIELLSSKTADTDKGKKKIIYQNQLKVIEYFWFDPFNPEDWEGFGLHHGEYVALVRDDQNRFISERLGLALVRWQGVYEEVETTWLRWATKAGQLLPTSREALEAETQRADAETQRAETEAKRAAAAEAELLRLQRLLAEKQDAGKKE
jgi:Uma2 family endonuclease